jgi:hypothetical protein
LGNPQPKLKYGPTLESVGSLPVKVSLKEEALSGWGAQWMVVVEDDVPLVSSGGVLSGERLTQDWYTAAGVGETWAGLKRPVYRVEVPSVVRQWQGVFPDRAVVDPSRVEVLRGSTWSEYGSLTPKSTAAVSEAGKSVSFGDSSFYFQDDVDGVVVPSGGLSYVLQDGSDFGSVLGVADDGVSGQMRGRATAGGALGAQVQWLVRSRGVAGEFGLMNSKTNKCVKAQPYQVVFVACDDADKSQGWKFERQELPFYQGTSADAYKTLKYAIVSADSGVFPGPYLTRTGTGKLTLSAATSAGVVPAAVWAFAAATANPVTAVRLRGGWIGDTDPVVLSSLPVPVVTELAATPNDFSLRTKIGASASAGVYNNGVDSVTGVIRMKVKPAEGDERWIDPSDPLAKLYRYAYFVDEDGKVITGLDSTVARGRSAVVLSNAPARMGDGAHNGSDVANLVSITADNASGDIKPRMSVGGFSTTGTGGMTVTVGDQSMTFDPTQSLEVARIGDGVALT